MSTTEHAGAAVRFADTLLRAHHVMPRSPDDPGQRCGPRAPAQPGGRPVSMAGAQSILDRKPDLVTAMRHYWLDDPDVPFHTLLCVVGTYCHPEAGPDAYGDLIRLARGRPDDAEMARFKGELARVLAGDTAGLHPDAVFTAACYPDGSDRAFGVRLWRHLYPGEPVPVRCFDSWSDWPAAQAALESRLPSQTVSRLAVAFDVAAQRHAGQTRPAGEPYVEHLLQTLEIVLAAGWDDPGVLTAALLHDVVEDTGCLLAEVHARFGTQVAVLVEWLTARTRSGGDRAECRLDYLRGFAEAPPDVVVVKVADRYSNVQRLHTHPRADARRRYYRETVEHLVPLARRHSFFGPLFTEWAEYYRHLDQAGR